MQALVVGFGSIGARHARILEALGCVVSVVSSRPVDHYPCFRSMEAAFEQSVPDYIVVANRTHEHYPTLVDLAKMNFQGSVLVEKPLYDGEQTDFQHSFAGCFVGYNLRFHPVAQKLSQALKGEKIISAQAYVGQYLPLWRPDRDYRTVYSARRSQGGGVLRDLSHELDLLQWLLGGWEKVVALMGNHSHLEIDSEDVVAILMSTQKCPVGTVQLNYLDRMTRRDLVINTDTHTFVVDFVKGTFSMDGAEETLVVERDETYRSQHLAVLKGDHANLCTFADGLAVVGMIDAVERSFAEERWAGRC